VLGNGKLNEIFCIDEKINKVIKNELDEINTPAMAFITFMT
jgi:hypothetical protein